MKIAFGNAIDLACSQLGKELGLVEMKNELRMTHAERRAAEKSQEFRSLSRPERMNARTVNALVSELRDAVASHPELEAMVNRTITVLYDFSIYKDTVRSAVQEAER